MIQGARGWCTGMTQRDGMGKTVGGGFRMGNTCTLSGATRMRPVRDKVRDKKGTCKAALPHTWLPWGSNMSSREPPGQERNLQGSSSPQGCPGGLVCPFLLSVLLSLGFLIFVNIIYSNKASLEKSKHFWKC